MDYRGVCGLQRGLWTTERCKLQRGLWTTEGSVDYRGVCGLQRGLVEDNFFLIDYTSNKVIANQVSNSSCSALQTPCTGG